jgi:hypothetical protein
MTITINQLHKMIKNSKLLTPMIEDSEIDVENLRLFKNLSNEEVEGLKTNAEYWMRNYATFEMSYAPQYDYEVTPIYIYGIRGLYLVKVAEEVGIFFDTKKEAIAYANEAIKVFFIDYE